jgi:uncharacterized protein YndB with AHSA1/START domain
MQALPAIQRSITVPLKLDAAFDLFVRRLPEWWPLATRSVGLNDAASCHVEAQLGGRLFERSRVGAVSTWGTFLLFDAPHRVIFTWHPGLPAASATEVEVQFFATGDETRVALEHRNWERLGEHASFIRGLFEGGWGPVLARFDALSRGASKNELPDVTGRGCIGAIPD